MTNDVISLARNVFDKEIAALLSVKDCLDESFEKILREIMSCTGKIILTGMGKSGHIARKAAATLSSLGTCAIFLHPGEALHGDLGMIQKHDLVIAVSQSGECSEIAGMIPTINMIGAKIIGITGNANSYLAKNASISQVFPAMEEACHIGLAPTCSTTSVLVYTDAIAVTAAILSSFKKSDFRKYHPSGALGKNLTVRIIDCMTHISNESILLESSTVNEAIQIMVKTHISMIPVCRCDGAMLGYISSDRLSEAIETGAFGQSVKSICNYSAHFDDSGEMAIDVLRIMNTSGVNEVFVLNNERPMGIVSRSDITSKGVVL
jgi:arabinose-5-phosphate isomerase